MEPEDCEMHGETQVEEEEEGQGLTQCAEVSLTHECCEFWRHAMSQGAILCVDVQLLMLATSAHVFSGELVQAGAVELYAGV